MTPDQIKAWDLPTRPAKRTDTRAVGWQGGSVEVDAIDPDQLRQLVRDRILDTIDHEALRKLLETEDAERETLERILYYARPA